MRTVLCLLMGVLAVTAAGSASRHDLDGRYRGCRFISWPNLARFTHASEAGEEVWTSPPTDAGIGWDELVLSWNAEVPPAGWLRAEARALYPGRETKWYVMGRWSPHLAGGLRESVPGQNDADGDVKTDTLVVSLPGQRFQVRFAGSTGVAVRFAGASLSAGKPSAPALEPNRAAWGKTLEVPERSQLSYPGGRGWCSPASTSMVMSYWAQKLGRPELDRDVPEVAQAVNDPKWPGAGNWPFNTAYAGSFPGIRAFVARFSDLSELEDWIASGVPVICSVLPRLLAGSDSTSTGHLVALAGFTETGDPIVNDPWARLESGQPVRRTYRRANFAAAWAVSRNTVYLIYPESHRPPKDRFSHWTSR